MVATVSAVLWAFPSNSNHRSIVAASQHQYWDRFVNQEKKFVRRVEYMYLNPAKKGRVERPDDCRWLSYDNVALDKATVAAGPIQIDDGRLPLGYRA